MTASNLVRNWSTRDAYSLGHAPHGFWPVLNQGHPAILFCFIGLYLSAAGPGPWSLDAKRGT